MSARKKGSLFEPCKRKQEGRERVLQILSMSLSLMLNLFVVCSCCCCRCGIASTVVEVAGSGIGCVFVRAIIFPFESTDRRLELKAQVNVVRPMEGCLNETDQFNAH